MDDASLDDFLDSSEDADSEPDAEPTEAVDTEDAPKDDGDTTTVPDAAKEASEDAESETAASDDDGVEPAVTTYQWTPSGAPCAVCGEQSTRRWQSEEGLVCPTCKEW